MRGPTRRAPRRPAPGQAGRVPTKQSGAHRARRQADSAEHFPGAAGLLSSLDSMATFTPSGQTASEAVAPTRPQAGPSFLVLATLPSPAPRGSTGHLLPSSLSLEGASNLASFPSLFHFLLLLLAGGQLPDLPSFRVGSGAESSPLPCRRLGVLDRKGCIPAGPTAAGAPAELLHLGACVQRLGPLQRDVPGEPEALLGFPEVLTGLLWWVWPPLSGTPRGLGSGTCQRPRALRPATPEPSAAGHALGGWKRLP